MHTSARTGRVPRTRTIVIASFIALAILCAGFAWFGIKVLLAKGELEALLPLAAEAEDAARSADPSRLTALADEAAEHSAAASQATADPVWAVGEVMPVWGANFSAVRSVAEALDEISSGARDVLTAVTVQSAAPQPGRIDVDALARAADPLARVAAAVERADAEVSAIDTAPLLPPVSAAVRGMSPLLAEASPALTSASDVVSALPGLLGAERDRTILLMIQNNAELRTGGGITGSFALLTASGGSLALVDQADSSDFPPVRDGLVRPVPEATIALYGDTVGRRVQNASVPADFAVAADLAAAWWERRTGARPDVVVSIDTVVVAALLDVAGSAVLPDGTELTADNAAARLLIEPYRTLDGEGQTAFQRGATAAILRQVLQAPLNPIEIVRGLGPSLAEGHISAWSADPAEATTLASSPLGGPQARRLAAGADDAYAVYFNDLTGGKMDVYLDVAIDVGARSCRADGLADVAVSVTLASTAPADAVNLPTAVTGGGAYGVDAGQIGTLVSVTAPKGTFLGGVSSGGLPVLANDAVEAGAPTVVTRVDLAPGAQSTVEFRFVSAAPGTVSPVLVHTPLLAPPVLGTVDPTCE